MVHLVVVRSVRFVPRDTRRVDVGDLCISYFHFVKYGMKIKSGTLHSLFHVNILT